MRILSVRESKHRNHISLQLCSGFCCQARWEGYVCWQGQPNGALSFCLVCLSNILVDNSGNQNGFLSRVPSFIEKGYPHKHSSGQAVMNSIEADLLKLADKSKISNYLPKSQGTSLSCTLYILAPRGPPSICQVGRHWPGEWQWLQGHESCSASIALSPIDSSYLKLSVQVILGCCRPRRLPEIMFSTGSNPVPCVLGWPSLNREVGPGDPVVLSYLTHPVILWMMAGGCDDTCAMGCC